MGSGSTFDWESVREYLTGLVPEDLRRMEEEGRFQPDLPYQPTIGANVAQLMDVLILATRPKRVLEIGTSAGYSAVAMGKALKRVGGKLVTVELDPRLGEAAIENIRDAGLRDVVDVLIDDANDVLPSLSGSFEMILQDGDKDDYLRMLKPLLGLLTPHGTLVTDDVLFPVMDLPEPVKPFQYALSLYNEALQEHPELHTVWLPIGDGVAISVKARPD